MKNKNIRRRLVVLLCFLLFCIIQNKWLTVSFYSYDSDKVTKELEGYRIVQISDLHNTTFGIGNSRLLKKIEKLKPDMILLTGDMIDSTFTKVDVTVSFGEECVKIAPTYYVTGNHENWVSAMEKQELIEGLTQAGVVCLMDEMTEITVGNDSFSMIGLNDESLGGSRLRLLLKEYDDSQLRILLAHEPQYLEHYAQNGVDLVFSGHAHGGQFRLPLIGGIVSPGEGFFPEYTEGIHIADNTTMVISRGLGNSIIPVRLFNYPEIVCVDLGCK